MIAIFWTLRRIIDDLIGLNTMLISVFAIFIDISLQVVLWTVGLFYSLRIT